MKKNTLIGSAALLGASLIWGTAFAAQKTGMKFVTPEVFNALRCFIGCAVLLPLILVMSRVSGKPVIPQDRKERRDLLAGGAACGGVLAFASITQQYGLIYSTAGKAGFITSLYIIFVPLAGVIFWRKSCGVLHWAAVALALLGSYLLCSPAGAALGRGDLWLLACALLFAGHILVIGHFSPLTDGVKMSAIQFFVAGVISLILAAVKRDSITPELFRSILGALLYCGVCSSGIAFTLQIISQKYIAGTTASILMSMESVFSVMGGFFFLGEKLSIRELSGCAVILAAVILAQLPASRRPEMRR